MAEFAASKISSNTDLYFPQFQMLKDDYNTFKQSTENDLDHLRRYERQDKILMQHIDGLRREIDIIKKVSG